MEKLEERKRQKKVLRRNVSDRKRKRSTGREDTKEIVETKQ